MPRTRLAAVAVSLALAAGAWVFVGSPSATAAARPDPVHRPAKDKTSPAAFNQAMRKLWEDHITWTRLFIVSASTRLPDQQATTDRLLRNQSDIGDAIKPFYGKQAGDQLTALLRQHILTAADLLAAAKAGDDAALQQSKTAWYANADDIAAFLTKANPKQWPLSETTKMMRTHLDLTLGEAVAHLEGRYEDDVAAYDKVHDEILQMADMLSSGIVHQFPKRFR